MIEPKKAELVALPMEEYDFGSDVYDQDILEDLHDDELNPDEAGFMYGYLAA